MEPLAPDWRTLGTAAPAPESGGRPAATAPHTVLVTPRLVAWVVGALVAAAIAGGSAFLALVPATSGVMIEPGLTDARAAAGTSIDLDPDVGHAIEPGRVTTPAALLVVDVEGAVMRPGLVHVPAGGRVGDALLRAGGFAANADLTRTAAELNLAQQVADGLKVVVPAIGQGPSTDAQSAPDRPVAGAAIDLNRATEAELDALPGVGPATIGKILAARAAAPFASPEDLRTRDLVGDAVFQKLQGLITVGR